MSMRWSWQRWASWHICCVLILLLPACASNADVGRGIPSPLPPTLVALSAAGQTPAPTPTTVPPTIVMMPTIAVMPVPSATPSPSASPTLPATGTATSTVRPIPSPTSTPTMEARATMRAATVDDLTGKTQLPRYALQLWIEPVRGVLSGTMELVFPNTTGGALDDIALRLYQNFPQDVLGEGGDVRMDVTGAMVDGRPVAVQYAAQRTAIVLPLAQPLAPDQTVSIAITWTATLTPAPDGSWPLPSYYPMLAVHDSDGWRLDVTRFADHVYAQSALYTAEITAPSDLRVVASGSTIATRPVDGNQTTSIIQTGPVREFAFTLGDFVVAQDTGGAQADVAVNVYTARGNGFDGRQIARIAAAAVTNFDRRFGLYPYRELDIHLLPGQFDGGDEYPGLILQYTNGQVDAGSRYVTAHEVGHQWWYGVVGNDIYREPWLDEALAQYSGIVYAEDVEGEAVAAADWEREVLRRYRGALSDGDLPVGRAIDAYPNFNVYYRTVYGKGAVFLRTLRQELGDELFFKGLQTYYDRHRYGVGTTEAMQQAFEDASGRELGELFGAWVRGR